MNIYLNLPTRPFSTPSPSVTQGLIIFINSCEIFEFCESLHKFSRGSVQILFLLKFIFVSKQAVFYFFPPPLSVILIGSLFYIYANWIKRTNCEDTWQRRAGDFLPPLLPAPSTVFILSFCTPWVEARRRERRIFLQSTSYLFFLLPDHIRYGGSCRRVPPTTTLPPTALPTPLVRELNCRSLKWVAHLQRLIDDDVVVTSCVPL